MNRQELAPAVAPHARSHRPASAARTARRLACIVAGLALLGIAAPGVGAEEPASAPRRGRRN